MAPRDSNDQSLGDVIRDVLNQYNLEGKLAQARVIEAWPKVAGDMIIRHTRDIYFRGSKLFITLDSPALKNELGYSKSKIILKLNEEAGTEVVREIYFK